jgi:hypothetical protein
MGPYIHLVSSCSSKKSISNILNSIVCALLVAMIWLYERFAALSGQTVSRSIWTKNIGQPTTMAVGGWVKAFGGNSLTRQFFVSVIIANVPQVGVSYLYLLFNGLLTSLVVSAEWASYGVGRRKGLRVSEKPQGYQKPAFYFLMPMRYGLSLTLASSLLQWLLSQTTFLVKTRGIDPNGNVNHHFDGSRIVYSPMGCILSLIIGGVLILALVPLALKR